MPKTHHTFSELGRAERLRAIIRALRHCNQDPSFEAVAAQLKYETREQLDEADYAKARKEV